MPLPPHLERGSLFVDPLEVGELPQRETIMRAFGIDLGEAACLVLAARSQAPALLLSADEAACRAAQAQDTPDLTLLDVLEDWVKQRRPAQHELEVLINGMKGAKYGISATFVKRFMSLL